MASTSSKRARDGAGNAATTADDPVSDAEEATCPQQQGVHEQVQGTIRTYGLQEALDDLDKGPATRPIADTIRLAISERNLTDASAIKDLQGMLDRTLRMLGEANAARDRMREAYDASAARQRSAE